MPILNIPIPEGRLGIKLQDGPEQGNVIRIEFVLEDSVMKGALRDNDVIIGIGGTKVSTIDELVPLHKKLEGDSRYFTIKRDDDVVQESAGEKDAERHVENAERQVDPHAILLDEEKGIEKVKLPEGSTIGIRLDPDHEVLEVVPTSIVLNMVHVGDRVVSLNDVDITDMSTKQFVKFLSKQDQKNRVLGIKRAPHSPRQVPLPPVERIGLVLRDDPCGWINCLELLDKSPLKGKIFPGDKIIGANCRKVGTIDQLIPLMKDTSHRVLTVVTPKENLPKFENGSSKRKRSPQKTLNTRRNKNSLKAKSVSEEAATITSYKTVGQEVFINVIAPKGKLGMKLGKNHEVKDLLSTSPLAGKLFKDDRIVSIDEVDIRGRDASSLAVLLMASQHRARALGVRRKTGKKIRVAVQEEKKVSGNDAFLQELEERFPTLHDFDVPLGDGATDTSTRCKILSELLALHETLGLANDVETENGSFCHVIKIPKKGLSRRGELMSTLDDVLKSLDSVCGETDASDLLLEFLANRSPSSFLRHTKIAESRPKKRRKIEESKRDPNLDYDSQETHETDGAADSQERIKNGDESGAKAGENAAADGLNESQTTGGDEGREAKKPKVSHDGEKSPTGEENGNASVTGAPNPGVEEKTESTAETGVATGGVAADPAIPPNGGTAESGESDPIPKEAAPANNNDKADSKDVEMTDVAN